MLFYTCTQLNNSSSKGTTCNSIIQIISVEFYKR